MYYIVKVRKDEDKVITELMLENGAIKSKTEIIMAKNMGINYSTKDKDGNNAELRVIDNKYLRSDKNNIKSDNLDELEEF